jgi:hypothetical protein
MFPRLEPEHDKGDAAQVAACTAAAAHRRDHHHVADGQSCHPHAVEVVHLGQRAVTICHDCERDSGFLPHLQAECLAKEHQDQTQAVSVPLPHPSAA